MGYNFEDASCPASAVIHYKADTEEAKDPTCTEPGRKGTNVCDVCGKSYSDKDVYGKCYSCIRSQLF